ncbi:uncharacterized protein NPIL_439901 [Nephila pilipes]|uniref:Uncharacterized protein n=1 Tax=Nephila pilipes TaxID=299642 RepID=A0A8X6PMX3_NEPPI|nr:uncharacterized protein NPIL_439901 [Nephila pilipes]
MLQIRRNAHAQRLASVAEFYNYIHTFCDQICQICHKLCYPNQVVKFNNSTPKEYLPRELYDEKVLLVCNRCNTRLRSKKDNCPSKAYWNNLLAGEIPDEILALTQPELRLLQRIIPYVKVIKYGGRFGQYGFKGNAILFALDIFQVSEKLPDMLPRSSENAAIVIVTETLDNLNNSLDRTISRDRVYAALRWLVKYNRLYKDVAINHFARLESEDIIRVIPAESNEDINPEIEQYDNDEETRKSTKYKRDIPLNNVSYLDQIEKTNIVLRWRYIQKVREHLKQRFKREYLGFLRSSVTKREDKVNVGDIVLIGTDGKKKAALASRKSTGTFPGKDGIIRLVKLRTEKGNVLRLIRLYPLELKPN